MSDVGPLSIESGETPGLSTVVACCELPASQAGKARRPDPLLAILGEGERQDPFLAGIMAAIALHVAILVFAISADLLKDMRMAMEAERARLHDFFWTQYEVEVDKPKVELPKPVEAVQEPEPAAPPPPPAAKAAPRPKDDPYDAPPPAPAQAAKVLTAKADPDEVKDLTGNTVVTGEGTVTYGQQSALGKGDAPTMSRAATLKGTPGGTGTNPVAAAPPPQGPDLSKGVGLSGGTSWNCPFPPEADADQVDQAMVTVQVTVRPDGSALSATVTNDPGHGFGRAARLCALGKRYSAALDRSGTPILSSAPVTVRFSR